VRYGSAPVPVTPARPTVVYERRSVQPTTWAASAPVVAAAPASRCRLPRNSQGVSLAPDGCPYGCFTIWLEGLYSFFDAPEGGFGLPPFLAGGPAVPDPIVWDGLDYEGAFGGRVTLQARTAPQSYVELRGTYYGSYESSARDAGQFGFLTGPGGVGGVIVPNAATMTAEADIFGAEINYWTEVACIDCASWNLGAGVHWVQLEESAGAVDWAAPFAPFTSPATITSTVENTFIGVQLGGMVRWALNPRLEFQGSVKGMVGFMMRDIVVQDSSVFSGGAHTATSEDDQIVAGLDVDLLLHLKLTRMIGITAGYNLLFVDNVVRAHDAFDFTLSGSGAVQAQQKTDQAIVHSLLVGVVINF
jgi:hypothetical protein